MRLLKLSDPESLCDSIQLKPRMDVRTAWRAALKVQSDYYKYFLLLLFPENHHRNTLHNQTVTRTNLKYKMHGVAIPLSFGCCTDSCSSH